LIENLLGKSIDQAFEEAEHTRSARLIFRDLKKVGYIAGDSKARKESSSHPAGLDGFKLQSKAKFDYTQGIFRQIYESNMTLEEYIEFINEPKHLVNPIRNLKLFNNPLLELVTMTPWYAIPLGWAPPIIYFFSLSEVSLLANILCIFLGIFFWTFAEYTLHRFVFHGEDYWLPDKPKILAFHFLIHGIHHAFPMDAYRLVFPPLPGYIIFFGFVIPPLTIFVPDQYMNAMTAGTALGYVLYDIIHYFLHHSQPKEGYWKGLKQYHLQHHYKNGTKGFGVSSKFWDHVFQTQI